jgi:predicted nuclease of predicted toxin-antitoxin system
MKFLLDENFPKSAEKLLIELGHEVIDIRGTELQGIDDSRLFELAQESEAILLTTDRDFYHTVPLRHAMHFGVIVIALKQPNRETILSKLHWIISQDLLENIQGKIYLLRDQTYRVR